MFNKPEEMFKLCFQSKKFQINTNRTKHRFNDFFFYLFIWNLVSNCQFHGVMNIKANSRYVESFDTLTKIESSHWHPYLVLPIYLN